MNIGSIKEPVGSKIPANIERKAEHNATEASPKKEVGQSKAVETHLTEQPLKQYSVKVLNESMEKHLSVMQQIREEGITKQFGASESKTNDTDKLRALDIGKAVTEAQEKPLFDFEKVATTVLDFVGGALSHAAHSGADETTLNEMLGQAREGVDKGIAEARKILGKEVIPGGIIDEGIKKSDDMIKEGFNLFEQQINDPENRQVAFSYKGLEKTTEVNQSQETQLTINTKDGDTVNINFLSLQSYQERLKIEQSIASTQGNNASSEEGQTQALLSSNLYNKNEFAFSLEGELDEDEKKAIASLMESVNELASEFFKGDVQAAFNQAKELGFNDSEISGFSLDLKQTQQTQINQSYKEVSAYQDSRANDVPNSVKQPLQDYTGQLLDMVNNGQSALSGSEDLENTIQKVVGHNFQLRGQELLDAFARFNHFNGQVLGNDLFELMDQNATERAVQNEPGIAKQTE